MKMTEHEYFDWEGDCFLFLFIRSKLTLFYLVCLVDEIAMKMTLKLTFVFSIFLFPPFSLVRTSACLIKVTIFRLAIDHNHICGGGGW